jgi:pimeloyl-ACP methyl ester carboxylesterase
MVSEHRHRIRGALNWEQLGHRGPPMVFLHPNPTDHSVWVYQMAHLSSWFRTVGIDLPGYGRSPGAEPGLTMTDIARACWEAVDSVSTEPAVLVGCSVGAHVALHMAHEQPDRTSAVILSGTSYRDEKTYCLERIEEYTKRGIEYRRDYFLEIVSPEWGATPLGQYFADLFAERNDTADVETIIDMFRALYVADPDYLWELRTPLQVISGTQDRAHDSGRLLASKVAGSEFISLEGAGHACQIEQPWAWDALAIDFLRRKGLFPGS